MTGCDSNKYGSFHQDLQARYSLEEDKYPKTLQKAVDAIDHHGRNGFDAKYYEVRKRERDRRSNSNNNNNNSNTNANSGGSNATATSFAQTPRTTPRNAAPTQQQPGAPNVAARLKCHCCGELGHISKYCPEVNNIAKKDWYVQKAMQAFHDQHAVDSDDEASSIASRSTTRTTASAPPASNYEF